MLFSVPLLLLVWPSNTTMLCLTTIQTNSNHQQNGMEGTKIPLLCFQLQQITCYT